MHRFTIPTTCAMFGLIQISTNIRPPIVNAYGTQDISILSSLLLELILEDNLKLTRSRV
ncbi:hypothetical protein DsansV1_C05g0056951 [Dioscorea sansibarensis]